MDNLRFLFILLESILAKNKGQGQQQTRREDQSYLPYDNEYIFVSIQDSVLYDNADSNNVL